MLTMELAALAALVLASTCLAFFFVDCPCCGGGADPCIFESDDFNRADSTNLGADWTESAGNWEIASNKLQITTANAAVKHIDAFPNGSEQAVQAVVRSTATGDKIRLFCSANSGLTAYRAVELTLGSPGTLKIISVIPSDTDTLLECDVTAAANTDHTLKIGIVSIPNGTTTAWLNGAVIGSVTGTGDHDGFDLDDISGCATGDTVTGTVTFDDFELQYYNADADADTCLAYERCCFPPQEPPPTQMEVTITGYAPKSPDACIIANCPTRCTGINGTYLLDGPGSTFNCEFTESIDTCCVQNVLGNDKINQIRLYPTYGELDIYPCRLQLEFKPGIAFDPYGRWARQMYVPGGNDCTLPVSLIQIVTASKCDTSSATVTVDSA